MGSTLWGALIPPQVFCQKVLQLALLCNGLCPDRPVCPPSGVCRLSVATKCWRGSLRADNSRQTQAQKEHSAEQC